LSHTKEETVEKKRKKKQMGKYVWVKPGVRKMINSEGEGRKE